MSVEMLPAVILRRKAVVYVRQSTPSQVLTNLESQRRQYDLSEVARRHGFAQSGGRLGCTSFACASSQDGLRSLPNERR